MNYMMFIACFSLTSAIMYSLFNVLYQIEMNIVVVFSIVILGIFIDFSLFMIHNINNNISVSFYLQKMALLFLLLFSSIISFYLIKYLQPSILNTEYSPIFLSIASARVEFSAFAGMAPFIIAAIVRESLKFWRYKAYKDRRFL